MFHYAQANEHQSSSVEVPTIQNKLSTKILRTVFKLEFAEFLDHCKYDVLLW